MEMGIEGQVLPDEIAQIVILAAMHYTHAIATLTPFANLLSPEQVYEVYGLVVAVPLSRWQQIPGIFLWVCFLSPFTSLSPSPSLSQHPSSPRPSSPTHLPLTNKNTDNIPPLPLHHRRRNGPLDPPKNGHLRNHRRE
jgi:hypothetical protein